MSVLQIICIAISVSICTVVSLNEGVPILFNFSLEKYEIIFNWIAYEKLGAFGKST